MSLKYFRSSDVAESEFAVFAVFFAVSSVLFAVNDVLSASAFGSISDSLSLSLPLYGSSIVKKPFTLSETPSPHSAPALYASV